MHQPFDDEEPEEYRPKRTELCAHGRVLVAPLREHVRQIDVFLCFARAFFKDRVYYQNAAKAMEALKHAIR